MALKLPPLSGLRLFEATARCGSFERAAQELNLTPGALSHGIDSLEQWLDVELFERKARGVILTAAGRQYLPYISEAFTGAIGEFRALLNLSHHQDRAGREVNQSIGPAAEHPLIEMRMTGGADHQQIGLEVAGKANDVAHRMPGQEMNAQTHLMLLGQGAGALVRLVETPCRGAGLLPYFLDEFRHVVDFLDRDQVQFGAGCFGNRDGEAQRAKGALRAIVGA